MKSVPWLMLALLAVAYGALLSCEGDHGHDHPHGEEGHSHGEGSGDHGHPHGDPKKDDTHGGPNDHHGAHGGAVDAHGHGHGHGHEGASEVVTRWGRTTQLFVEFPALVVGEDSPFAAHLTRLQDHFAIDKGKVVVELSGGNLEKEYFSIDRPAIAGIFRPIVRPAKAGKRRITLRLDSVEAAEVHDLGEFTVYASRKQADAAAKDDADPPGTISYLLEQQWKVPFRVEHVEARHMRPNFTAFARLVLPSDAEAVVTAPRDGRVTPAAGRFPIVGETFATDGVLFALSSAPVEGVGPATLDLGVEQATIRVEAAKREVNRLTPLVEQGVVAQRRLDDANSALAQAQAELRSARRRRGYLGQSQRIKKLGARDGLAVPSPIAGSIAELYVAPGAWVNKGDKLARIVNRDALWLDVGVPEAYVGRLGQVSGAWFHLDNVYGVIEVPRSALLSVGTEVNPKTRTLPVRFRIDNVRRELFAGMTAQAHLIADVPQLTVAVPVSAVLDDNGMHVVYLQTGGETFVRHPVRLGIRDGDYVEIVEGVPPGKWVVSRGAYSVKLAATSTESIGHGHAH